MDPHDSAASRLIRSLKRHVDELVVQLSLGKAEAVEQVEHGKELLREKIDRARQALPGGGVPSSLAGRLDHLRLQLALGRMETRDAVEHQREKIHEAIEEVREEIHELDETVREDLGEAAEGLQLKLNALALNLGIAALVAEDEARTLKDELSLKASRLAERLKSSASEKGDEVEEVAREAREAYDDIKDNLRRLFR